MNSTQQQCFMLAAELLNFTKAAEQLYITQPALSRNISAMEEELELLLFVRNNNVLEITPGGRLLYDWMKQTKTNFSQVLEAARRINSEAKQALRIGFIRSEQPTETAAKALKLLVEAEPDLELQFSHYHSREIITHLEEHSMDVAVMVDSATKGHSRLVNETIATLRRCIAVSIKHPLAFREEVSLKDFSGDTFISVVPEVSATLSSMIRRVCGEQGFTPILLEAESTEEQLQWIVSGKGVGLLVENHVMRQNPLYSFLRLEEELPVDLVCTWDRLNFNPHIPKLVEALRKIQ